MAGSASEANIISRLEPMPPKLVPTGGKVDLLGADLTERVAGMLVVDMVNLALDDEWDKRAQRIAGPRSMETIIAAGEQVLSFLCDLPDSTRMPVGQN